MSVLPEAKSEKIIFGVHSQKERRYICRQCKVSFSHTTGTVFYRLRKGANLITLVVQLLAHGCPIQALVFAFALDERTVRNWLEKSGQHAQAVPEHLVERPRALGQVQEAGRYLVGGIYNFCTEHESLRLPGLIGGHKWLARTPAMARGITNHCWTVNELLSLKVPPPR